MTGPRAGGKESWARVGWAAAVLKRVGAKSKAVMKGGDLPQMEDVEMGKGTPSPRQGWGQASMVEV